MHHSHLLDGMVGNVSGFGASRGLALPVDSALVGSTLLVDMSCHCNLRCVNAGESDFGGNVDNV